VFDISVVKNIDHYGNDRLLEIWTIRIIFTRQLLSIVTGIRNVLVDDPPRFSRLHSWLLWWGFCKVGIT
jgi:hypothetical protein